METYLNCKQKNQEETTEYKDRLRRYRYRPYQGQWPCDTWEEYLQKVTAGLIDGQLAAKIEREKPQNTENLWGLINREETKQNRAERSQGIRTAGTGIDRGQARLEDRYGNRTQIQPYTWRDSSLRRCSQCNQKGHIKVQCTWIAGANAPYRARAVFQEGSL